MSKYTTEVRYYCETLTGLTHSAPYPDVQSIVTKAAPKIFENFPIYDETYRLVLETKILRHYYTREICAETPGLWKLWLNNRMNEIMPYYNQLYRSAMLDYNPLHDYDLTRQRQGSANTTKNMTGEGKTVNNQKTANTLTSTQNDDSHTTADTTGSGSLDETKNELYKYANTPQGDVQGNPIFTDYLTEASNTDGDLHRTDSSESNTDSKTTAASKINQSQDTTTHGGTSTTTSQDDTINTTDQYIEHIYGKMGTSSYALMVKEYRENILNIDQMIIDELQDLFMMIW